MRSAADLAAWLLPHAIETDRRAHLAGLVVEECRRRRIVVPSPGALERLCVQIRYRARGQVQSRLTDGLSTDQRRRLDALTQRRAETNQSWLAWLRQIPEAAKPVAMLGLIERLDHVRAAGLGPARASSASALHSSPASGRTTVQHVAGYERQRRHATLVAVTLDLTTSLTDQAIKPVRPADRDGVSQSRGAACPRFHADGRAINEKVRLYARLGAALIAACDNKQDAFDAITAVIPWDRFLASVKEAEALARRKNSMPTRCLASTMPASADLEIDVLGNALDQLSAFRQRGAAREGRRHAGAINRCDHAVQWLFLDLNAFFASCEQQEKPALRGQPVIVVQTPTDSAVAIAASYAVKASRPVPWCGTRGACARP